MVFYESALNFCRLRHALSDEYLCVLDDIVCTVSEVCPGCEFEIRLNIDEKNEMFRDYIGNVPVPVGSNIRIFHRDGAFLSLNKKNAREGYCFALEAYDYDKDVYLTIPVKARNVDIIIVGKRIYDGLTSFAKRLLHSTLPRVELGKLQSKAAAYVRTLIGESGYLDDNGGESMTSSVELSNNVCIELGLVWVLLELAECAFSRASKAIEDNGPNFTLTPQEDALAHDSYAALSELIVKSKDTAHQIQRSGGISTMVKHLTVMSNKARWQPPLMQLVDAIHADSSDLDSSIIIMTPADIELLLDVVYKSILGGKVPDTFPYKLLARVCHQNSENSSSSALNTTVNKKMQLQICNQLLGSPFGDLQESTGWSALVYRTAVEVTPRDALVAKHQLVVSTTSLGQIRPSFRTGT